MQKIIGLVLLRGGSKRIPRKNIKELNGKPLCSYIIDTLSKSKFVDEIYVSTEDKEIAKISADCGATVIERPLELADDYTTSESVIEDFSKKVNFSIFVLAEATQPLITTEDIDGAIKTFLKSDCESLIVLENRKYALWGINGKYAKSLNHNSDEYRRSQEFEGCNLQTGVWITSKEAFLKSNNTLLSGKIGYYIIPHISIDIDNAIDFEIAELVIKKQIKENQSK